MSLRNFAEPVTLVRSPTLMNKVAAELREVEESSELREVESAALPVVMSRSYR